MQYVLIDQYSVPIEHYWRQADGTWLLRDLSSVDELAMEAIGCRLAVDEIYRGIELSR